MGSSVEITIEGRTVPVEDREYSGAELRQLGGLAGEDKLVLEGSDGSETAIPSTLRRRVVAGENYFKSVRHRRG